MIISLNKDTFVVNKDNLISVSLGYENIEQAIKIEIDTKNDYLESLTLCIKPSFNEDTYLMLMLKDEITKCLVSELSDHEFSILEVIKKIESNNNARRFSL